MLTGWKLRLTLRRTRQELQAIARLHCPSAKVFSREGATPAHVSLCIATSTDEERDRMRREPDLYQQFRNTLVRVGYPSDAIPAVKFRIESQETVDRDYGGSWWEESEKP